MRLIIFSTIPHFRACLEGKPVCIFQPQKMQITKPARIPMVLILVVTVLALGCSEQKSQPVSTSTPQPKLQSLQLEAGQIFPGEGIEGLKLGQSGAEAERLLGAPSERDKNEYAEGQTYLLFHSKGVELSLQDDQIVMITLHAGQKDWEPYTGATAEGVGPTSTGKEVVDAFGTADDEAPRALKYLSKGLVFRFDENREGDGSNARVESVSVIPVQ